MAFAKRSQSPNKVFETVLTVTFGKISPAAKIRGRRQSQRTLNLNVTAARAISWREPASGYPLLAERTQRAARSTPESNTEAGLSKSFGATPPPATLPLFAGGLGVVGYLTRRRKRSAR